VESPEVRKSERPKDESGEVGGVRKSGRREDRKKIQIQVVENGTRVVKKN
jgi:hypothetical protein